MREALRYGIRSLPSTSMEIGKTIAMSLRDYISIRKHALSVGDCKGDTVTSLPKDGSSNEIVLEIQ
jgi:hypothetical protein